MMWMHAEGTYAPEELIATFDQALAHPDLPRDARIIPDVTRSESLAARPVEDLRRIVDHFLPHAEKSGNKCALIAEAPVHYGLMRMAATWSEAQGVQIRAFKRGAEAVAWLESGLPATSE